MSMLHRWRWIWGRSGSTEGQVVTAEGSATGQSAAASGSEGDLPAVRSVGRDMANAAVASAVARDEAELASTPGNFPGMHSVPRFSSPSSSQASSITRRLCLLLSCLLC